MVRNHSKLAFMPRPPSDDKAVTVRLPASWIAEFAQLAKRLQDARNVHRVTSSDIVRRAIANGMESVRSEVRDAETKT
jgi:hypothetical protein